MVYNGRDKPHMCPHLQWDIVNESAWVNQGVDMEECLALLTPLLRCIGNMGASKAASQSLLTAQSVAAVQSCAECPLANVQAESQWVMAMLSALAKR